MSKPDGGPAFPGEQMSVCPDGVKRGCGMSLRDYFAGQAMSGYRAMLRISDRDALVRACYQDADAMLAERAKSDE